MCPGRNRSHGALISIRLNFPESSFTSWTMKECQCGPLVVSSMVQMLERKSTGKVVQVESEAKDAVDQHHKHLEELVPGYGVLARH